MNAEALIVLGYLKDKNKSARDKNLIKTIDYMIEVFAKRLKAEGNDINEELENL